MTTMHLKHNGKGAMPLLNDMLEEHDDHRTDIAIATYALTVHLHTRLSACGGRRYGLIVDTTVRHSSWTQQLEVLDLCPSQFEPRTFLKTIHGLADIV